MSKRLTTYILFAWCSICYTNGISRNDIECSIHCTQQCTVTNHTYQPGEVLDYLAYYNWGFIWVNAGWVEFKVKDTIYQGREVYHFDSYGSSHKSYDWLFKVRDSYQSFMDKEHLQPVWFHRQNYEGGYEVDNKYLFDHEKNEIYSSTWNSDKEAEKDTLPLQKCTFDVLSLIYHARNLNFDGLQIRDTVPVRAIIDNEIFDLYVRYLGKERIKTKLGDSYDCIKFSALLVEGTIFKGGEDMVVWVTDDANRIPVAVEAKILIGSVKAFLVESKGLRN